MHMMHIDRASLQVADNGHCHTSSRLLSHYILSWTHTGVVKLSVYLVNPNADNVQHIIYHNSSLSTSESLTVLPIRPPCTHASVKNPTIV